MEPRISIIIPTYNRRDRLQRLLDALGTQTCPAEQFEVIVVDDGSDDGTVEQLASLQTPYALRALRQPHCGPSVARNAGVQAAQSALVLFLDDDVVPEPELLATHLSTHEAHSDAVVIGPMMPSPPDWPRAPWVRWEEDLLQIQYAELIAGKYPCTPRQFYTANASLARPLVLAAGGFDPAFQRAEDVEFAYRLRDHGVQFIFEPAAKVMHFPSRSYASWCRIPYLYGRYDVVMHRERGHEALACATSEFHQRHWLNRRLARLCVGSSALVPTVVTVLGGLAQVADRLGVGRPARLALSSVFQVLYWQGVSDELGGPEVAWLLVDGSAPGRDQSTVFALLAATGVLTSPG